MNKRIKEILSESVRLALLEFVSPQVDIKALEANYKILSPKLKEIVPSNVKEWYLFKQQVDKLFEAYFATKDKIKLRELSQQVLRDFVLNKAEYKRSLLEVLDNFPRISITQQNILVDFFETGGVDISSLNTVALHIQRKVKKYKEEQRKIGGVENLFALSIKNYTVRNDGTVDVEGDVVLTDKKLTKLPVKFGKITGSFSCDHNKLTSLEGAPEFVGKYFDCRFNKLISPEGAPKFIGTDFYGYGNAKQFTKEEVRAVSNVKGDVRV